MFKIIFLNEKTNIEKIKFDYIVLKHSLLTYTYYVKFLKF